MRTWPGTGLPVEQVDRHTRVALIGPDKLMGTTTKGKSFDERDAFPFLLYH